MLTWIKGNKRDSWLGFDDGTLLYKVYNEGTGFGWEWEYVPDMDGFDGYNTMEEAMADAEADHASHEVDIDEEEEGYTLEEMEDIYWDAVAHERMEQRKMGW